MTKNKPEDEAAAGGVELRIKNLQQWVRKDLNLLQDISLVFNPGEFVVIVGQSGGGKSTLINAISGLKPPSHGSVQVDGLDLYKNYHFLRDRIGYVPQKDIIHMELNVKQALDYSARLRLPRETKKAERDQRVQEVLVNLDLSHRQKTRIGSLSGGQQKRVSIGVELLTRPSLFFLDEPTSGLDPGSETTFMQLMRRLADQGRTIVLVTHATKNVMLADKVVFLARGGYLAWFGPPDEALKYFTNIRNEIGLALNSELMEFDQIYALLEDARAGTAEDWSKRYQNSPEMQKYIAEPLSHPQQAPRLFKKLLLPQPLTGFKQFFILSSRNVNILLRDKASLALMLLSAPAMGCLDLLLAPIMGSNIFDFYQGKGPNSAMTLFLITLYAILVGALAQMREFTKERDIFKRERLAGLRIIPYVTSKVWLALLLAIYHGAAFTLLRYAAFQMPGGSEEFWLILFTMALCSFSAMMLGLFASARSASPAAAPLVVIILILPNIVLSGVLVNLPKPVSAISSTYWTFRSLVAITGIGSDVAADACWKFPDQLRMSMTLEDKEYFNCRCLGMAVFDQTSCNFPGNGAQMSAALTEVKPQEPAPLAPPPQQPLLPASPESPSNQNDPVAVAQYLNELQDYQKTITQIQSDYAQQMASYQMEADLYKLQTVSYQRDLSAWYARRTAAVGATEAMILGVRDRFGWAFVDKSNRPVYFASLIEAWGAMGMLDLILFIIMTWRLKQGDRK